ncbi:MAG: AraC family transcriptional regulator [Cytophagaceae bacterium]|nr:AraC family transcriptional regulator [Cytophagaceae bacterium]MDW8457093.1 AraC family transcriptional regulator [Cytophagaceae bacterium]
MKPIFEKVSLPQNFTYTVRAFNQPYFDMPWHYHPEYELTLITKGEGKRYVGDCIEKFSEGDLVFLGSELPHFWKCNEEYYQNNPLLTASSIVIHFGSKFPENNFFELEEMHHIKKLFSDASLGLSFNHANSASIKQKIIRLNESRGIKQHIMLLEILYELSQLNYQKLSSPSFNNSLNIKDSSKINKVYSYVMENFREDIKLKDVAQQINMSEAAFSRYFKKKTKKTFSKFISELRIGYACKLLINTDWSIVQIGYESGYNNLSLFNRQFKRITNRQPKQYRKEYQKV